MLDEKHGYRSVDFNGRVTADARSLAPTAPLALVRPDGNKTTEMKLQMLDEAHWKCTYAELLLRKVAHRLLVGDDLEGPRRGQRKVPNDLLNKLA